MTAKKLTNKKRRQRYRDS